MKTLIYTDRPLGFWGHMGRFFADRALHKDLPGLFDEPGRVWFVLTEGESVLGFGSVDIDKEVGHLRNLYVHPDHRGTGLASRLMEERLQWLRAQGVPRARTSRKVSKEIHFAEHHGFSVVRTEGNWEILEASLEPLPAPTPQPERDEEAYQAGYAEANKLMNTKAKQGRKVLKSRPSSALFAKWQGDRWESFQQGWIAALKDRRSEFEGVGA